MGLPAGAPEVLSTSVGITLRKPRADDGVDLYAAVAASRAQLMRWMDWCSATYGPADAGRWLDSTLKGWGRDNWSFVMVGAADNGILGVCGLDTVQHNNRLCNLGYWVRSDCTGRGLATAATQAVARFGLQYTQLQRLEVVVASGNLASLAVARRSGAVREGVLRSRLYIHGVAHDAVMHAFVAGTRSGAPA